LPPSSQETADLPPFSQETADLPPFIKKQPKDGDILKKY